MKSSIPNIVKPPQSSTIRATWAALVILTLTCMTAVQAEEPLAQPGFIGHERASCQDVFGFATVTSKTEPGIWAALLVTEDQGKQLSEAWHATWGKRIDEGLREPEDQPQMAALEKEYNARRAEILTSEQRKLINSINQAAYNIGQGLGGDLQSSEDFRRLFMENLKSVLSDEQFNALEANLGQKL